MSRGVQFLKNVTSDVLLFSISLVVGVLITPFTVRFLGRAAFGLWATIRSIIDYIGLLDAGLSNAVPRFVAHYRAKKDWAGVKAVIATSFITYSLINALILGAVIVLSSHLPRFIKMDDLPTKEGAIAFVIAGFILITRLFTNPLRGTIFGYERLYVVNGVTIIAILSQALLTVLILMAGLGVIGVALASLIATLLMGNLLLIYVRKAMPVFNLDFRHFRLSVLRELIEYSSVLLLIVLSMRLILSTNNIVIGHFVGVSSVASYAIAFQVIEMARQVILRVGRALIPVYSRHYALGERGSLQRIFLEISSVSLAVGIIITLLLFFFGEYLIKLWVGEGNFVGRATFWLLCPFVLIQSAVVPSQVLLLSIRRHRYVALLRGLEGVLNLLLTILFVERWKVFGVALGTLLSAVSTTLWGLPLATIRELKMPIAVYLRGVVFPHFILGLSLFSLGYTIQAHLMPYNLLRVAVLGNLLALIYGLSYWLLFTRPEQRSFYLQLVAEVRKEMHNVFSFIP